MQAAQNQSNSPSKFGWDPRFRASREVALQPAMLEALLTVAVCSMPGTLGSLPNLAKR